MPKQIYKILQFHGGLSSNSDARDIAENELSEATDVMVDEIGKIRLMGGINTSTDPPDNAAVIKPGYGLFQFSHDRTGAELKVSHYGSHTGGDSATVLIDSAAAFTSGLVGGTVYNISDGSSGIVASVDSGTQITVDDLRGGDSDTFDDSDNDLYVVSWPQTGNDYLAMTDADGAANVDIYSRVADAWGTAKVDLGSTTGMKSTFYFIDGALRISDGNFGADNESKWYGYIDRYFYGDGITGLDQPAAAFNNGIKVDEWIVDEAAPKALAVQGVSFVSLVYGVAASPIALFINNKSDNDAGYPGTGGLKATHKSFAAKVNMFTNENVVFLLDSGTPSSVTQPGVVNFCSPGDWLLFKGVSGGVNTVPYQVVSIDSGDPNIITVDGTISESLADWVTIFNLSRHDWFDGDNQAWEFAVSTLYDDSKQESPLHVFSTKFDPEDICGDNGTQGMSSMSFAAYVYTGDGTSTGLHITDPRVSGFNIYMRREDSGSWYQQANVDITKGIKLPSDESYGMWYGATTGGGTVYNAKTVDTAFLDAPSEVITYEDSSGITGATTTAAFSGIGTGFKTAVVANRRVYVANFKANDSQGNVQVYGDAIMKSQVGKFDSFSLERRLEAEIRDGDEIVKLEEYADRLLQFKKKKMTLINISQEVEFIEDTFIHKGISHPAASCKTDFGIAWVNKQGCYLYDGQKVNNLLEKQGRQIIKESLWATFTTLEPMIGYIPKKRQLLIANDVTTSGDGATFLYDMVTQSWVEGAAATITSEDKTNFVTDWNQDLIYAHSAAGTIVKWDDSGDDSTAFVIQTKDIDFGQPAQAKRIYKVHVTYTGVSSLSVNVDYQTNGDSGWTGFASGEPLTASSGQNEAILTLSSPVECYSFQLKFSGTGKTAFEINDVSIVFRLKGQR